MLFDREHGSEIDDAAPLGANTVATASEATAAVTPLRERLREWTPEEIAIAVNWVAG